MKKVGVLVHGLFLQANGWEEIVWGKPPYKLGSIPKAVEVMLSFGLENIACVVFGTGASEKDGLKEAQYTRRDLRNNMRRLEGYPSITGHYEFQSRRGLSLLSGLIDSAIMEVVATVTVTEIANAAKHFAAHGCDVVIQVPICGSHSPRCVQSFLRVKETPGNIPHGQLWMVAPPDSMFANSTIGEVAIVEPPHRADDPMLDAPIKAHQVVPRLFKMAPPARMEFLVEADNLLREKYGV